MFFSRLSLFFTVCLFSYGICSGVIIASNSEVKQDTKSVQETKGAISNKKSVPICTCRKCFEKNGFKQSIHVKKKSFKPYIDVALIERLGMKSNKFESYLVQSQSDILELARKERACQFIKSVDYIKAVQPLCDRSFLQELVEDQVFEAAVYQERVADFDKKIKQLCSSKLLSSSAKIRICRSYSVAVVKEAKKLLKSL